MAIFNQLTHQVVTWTGEAVATDIQLVAAPGANSRLRVYSFCLGNNAASSSVIAYLHWGLIASGNALAICAITGVGMGPHVIETHAGPLNAGLYLSLSTVAGTPQGTGWVRYEVA